MDDDEDGYVFVSCYIFFEEWWSGKPAGISTWIDDKLSQQAYGVLSALFAMVQGQKFLGE